MTAVNKLREMELEKAPGVAETIDWVASLQAVGEDDLTIDGANDTLGAILKDRNDLEMARENLQEII